VEVNLVAIRKGSWKSERVLDGHPVSHISSRLDDEGEREPRRLASRTEAFQGSITRGIGFVLNHEEACRLTMGAPQNEDCLLPYLTGEDLNSRPDQSPSRSIICFYDWPLESARRYPKLLEIVEQRVKPERERVKQDKDRRNWWLFSAYRVELHKAIRPLRRVLVRSRVSEMHALTFVEKGLLFGEHLIVFAFDDDYHFALLQSNIHEAWVRRNASTMRTDIRYTPTDCFETFAFPQNPGREDRDRAASIGGEYHEHRRQTMLGRQLGLTKTYNRFHNPDCKDGDIARLRELHAGMDRAILRCYGWSDIDPGHGFHQNARGQARFTISPDARREILRRLLDLNLEIAAKEAGVGSATSANRRRKARGEVRDAV
jgi:hypothetical protein